MRKVAGVAPCRTCGEFLCSASHVILCRHFLHHFWSLDFVELDGGVAPLFHWSRSIESSGDWNLGSSCNATVSWNHESLF